MSETFAVDGPGDQSHDEEFDPSGAAELAANEPPAPEVFQSPRDTASWIVAREQDVEVFTSPDGRRWCRAQSDEPHDALVHFDYKWKGRLPLRLVIAEHSYALKGAHTRARRKQRELTKRGYA